MTDRIAMDLAALARALDIETATVRRWLEERAAVNRGRAGLPLAALSDFARRLRETSPGQAPTAYDLAAWRAWLDAGRPGDQRPGDADGQAREKGGETPGMAAADPAALEAWVREFFFWLGRHGQRVELAAGLLGLPEALVRGEAPGEERAPGGGRPPLLALYEELGVGEETAGGWYERFGRLFPHGRESLEGFARFRATVPSRPIVGAFKLWNPDDGQWSAAVPAADRVSAVRAFLAAAGVVRLPAVLELLTRRGRTARGGRDGRERSTGFVSLCAAMGLDPDIFTCYLRARPGSSAGALFMFADWMTAGSPGRAPVPGDVGEWARSLTDGKGQGTVSARRSQVTAFLSWLGKMGLIEGDFGRQRTRVATEGPDVDTAPLCALLGILPATLDAWCREASPVCGMDAPRLRGTLGLFGSWLAATGRTEAAGGELAAWKEQLAADFGAAGASRRLGVLRKFLTALSRRDNGAAAVLLASRGRRAAVGPASRGARYLALCPLLGVGAGDIERWLAEDGSPGLRRDRRGGLTAFAAYAAGLAGGPDAGTAADGSSRLTAATVTAWRDSRPEGGKPRPVTRARFSAVLAFFRWLREQDLFALPGLDSLDAGTARAVGEDRRLDALCSLAGISRGDLGRWLGLAGGPRTGDARRRALLSLAEYLESRPSPGEGAPSLAASDLEAWAERPSGGGRPAAGADGRARTARRFFVWLRDEGLFTLPGLDGLPARPRPAAPAPELPAPDLLAVTDRLFAAMGIGQEFLDRWMGNMLLAESRRCRQAIGRFARWMSDSAPGRAPQGRHLYSWGRSLARTATKRLAVRSLRDVGSFFIWLRQQGAFVMDGLPGTDAGSGTGAGGRRADPGKAPGPVGRGHAGTALCRAMGIDSGTPGRWRAACRAAGRNPSLTGVHRLSAWLAARHPGAALTADLVEAWSAGLQGQVSAVACSAYRGAVRAFLAWLEEQNLYTLDRPLSSGSARRASRG